MRHGALLALAFALAGRGQAAEPAPARWPQPVVRMIAADALAYAPPDLKRMIARHASRLMAGVNDAASADAGASGTAERRAAAARGARGIATIIRGHARFSEVAYQIGGLVYEAAHAFPPPPAEPAALTRLTKEAASFLGYPPDPFRDPERIAEARLPAATPRLAYDSSLTLSTRLLAWVWKTAGGDVRAVAGHPEAKGPYYVREND